MNSGATLFWDADGPINGPITFNNGALLILQSYLRLGTSGNLVRSTFWPPMYVRRENKKIVLGGDFTIGSDARAALFAQTSNLTIDGQGHTVTMLNGSTFYADEVNLTLKNMHILYSPGANLPTGSYGLFEGWNGSGFILENVTISTYNYNSTYVPLLARPSGSSYSITTRGRVAINARGAKIWMSRSTNFSLVIDKNSTLYIGPGTEVLVNGDTAQPNTISMTDPSSILHLNGCKFYTGTGGLVLKKGTVFFENKVQLFNCYFGREASPNTDIASGLILGDGTPSNDVNVRVLGDAYVVNIGCMDYKNS